ncbi:hypothetical protein GGR51DRAFT_342334 [Nemania sp. FL0031]|nr:hypothetical protein GGR51DRAFT_342334 [Nemania sp. FL0031]
MIMTYVPNITFTYCILFGCDAKTKEKVFARLCDPNHAVHNPFFLVGILVELERERHTALVKAKINLLQNATLNRSRLGGDWKEIEAMDVWLDTHSVKNGLESWKAQLSKMIAAIGELSEVWIKSAGSNDYGREGWVRGDERMFKKWILDIVDDYDIEIRKCVMVMESMNIATKLAHTRANLEIAASTKRYYNQLRWTSLLTAIAVTAIFVASIFP